MCRNVQALTAIKTRTASFAGKSCHQNIHELTRSTRFSAVTIRQADHTITNTFDFLRI